jgi:prepilin-type processing-associated H-X9-DG protein
VSVSCFFFFGLICPGLLSTISMPPRSAPPAKCTDNLKAIGKALLDYHNANKHFPPLNICDNDGKPLLSWRVQLLPMMGHADLYNALKKDEPWNSPHNSQVLNQISIKQYKCPSDKSGKSEFATNYVAIIGPDTAWSENGPIKLSDLPGKGAHTVMAVEVTNSDVHWAEPRDLTVDDALRGLENPQGLRISTCHPHIVNVLFADGSVRYVPSKTSISVWRKVLAGEAKDIDSIKENTSDAAADMVDLSVPHPSVLIPGKWIVVLGAAIWLVSSVLLFRRAIKSRRIYSHSERSEESLPLSS